MRKPYYFAAIAFFVFVGRHGLFGQAQTASSPSPKCFFQILNGASSGPIDVYSGKTLIIPALATGQRVFMVNSPTEKIDLRLVDKQTGHEFKEKVELAEGGFYTLVLTGDFSPLPQVDPANPVDPPPLRFQARFLDNKAEAGSPVRVRFVNGMLDQPVTIKFPHGKKSWTVPPLGEVSALGLPADLYLEAYLGEKKRTLYLSQAAPGSNISIVFFPLSGSLGFKALTEINAKPHASEGGVSPAHPSQDNGLSQQ